MAAILEMFIKHHVAGYLVLSRGTWPDADELAEMVQFVDDCAAGEAITRAAALRAYVDKYGGPGRISTAMQEFEKADAETADMLRRVGSPGLPGAESLEAIAESLHTDAKTLRRRTKKGIENIALLIVCGG